MNGRYKAKEIIHSGLFFFLFIFFVIAILVSLQFWYVFTLPLICAALLCLLEGCSFLHSQRINQLRETKVLGLKISYCLIILGLLSLVVGYCLLYIAYFFK